MQRWKIPALGMQCRFRIAESNQKMQKTTCEDSRSCRQIQARATVVECNALSVFILHHFFPLRYTNCARKIQASESRNCIPFCSKRERLRAKKSLVCHTRTRISESRLARPPAARYKTTNDSSLAAILKRGP
jgi:hypothetical protein